MSIGPNATLALGLTECCAHYGRGKVYYYLKGTYIKSQLRSSTYPDSYIQLPDLLYVDYKWMDGECDAWMRSPHWQRLDLLSARGNSLHIQIPTMPITLCHEKDNYENIQFFEGFGKATMYYNARGAMYLGFLANMAAVARYIRMWQGGRPRWMANKVDVAQFQMRSGRQAAQQLQAMYRQRHPRSVYIYGDLVTNSAHRDWVAAGGYTVTSDPTLGPELAQRIATVQIRLAQDVQPPAEAAGVAETATTADEAAATAHRGHGLQALRSEAEGWPDNQKQALEDYIGAANMGVLAVSRLMISDENWSALTTEQKESIVNIWQLEQEAYERTPDVEAGS
ncbi:hypothetical protein LTR99_009433 [Exophiala xenobiotica]|uniref:Uncharacterized protein n=1 Tax=Vermiconidia calcicola TaxID=1690605 RepID=A0AAV9PYQ9_9PEZI|nr:hypothetical protein LTR96_005792 [Exophiala xenobiotica]KAK5530891.1 hypothetical protein LTR25_008748 [Vermiconidia calcicola]KAK5544383.1 hypothetical protein LTR23_004471 [Chaetothyriales sp. CCFEE 6169]KAK5294627.1 hypothetical protein LTR99_009433 [Exophiala xenobiotica]KAK5337349.1 hypothetical protein LTR98_006464 [Exophiala xenobiotica]